MSTRSAKTLFFVSAALLFVYAGIFPLLTIDTLAKIFARATTYETRNLFLLLFLELSRLFTTAVALGLAAALVLRNHERRDARALVLFLLFATITYEKIFGSNGYPGHVQEKVSEALFAAGASPKLLLWLFGPIAWSIWPTAAALTYFSAQFPRTLESAQLQASGLTDRRGMLRASGPAGADVGAMFRKLSESLLERGWFWPARLSIAAIVMIGIHTVLGGSTARYALLGLGVLLIGVIVTNLRASYHEARGPDHVRMTWIVEGFVVVLFIFLVSGAALITPLPAVQIAAFVLMMMAPAALAICFALSILDQGELDSANAVAETVGAGVLALVTVAVFGMVFRVFDAVAASTGMSHALALGAAGVVMLLGFGALRRGTDSLRVKVLEQNPGSTVK